MHHAARRHLRNRQLGTEGKLIILPSDAEVGGPSLKSVWITSGPCLQIKKGLSTGRKEVAESVCKGSVQTKLFLIFSAPGRGSYHSTAVRPRQRSPWQFRYSLEAVLYHSCGAQNTL